MWRTLIRVEAFDCLQRVAYVVLPGWECQTVICLHFEDITDNEVVDRIKNNQVHFHAYVNLGAEDIDELQFSDWEYE